LLHSCPGGVEREQIVGDLPGGKNILLCEILIKTSDFPREKSLKTG